MKRANWIGALLVSSVVCGQAQSAEPMAAPGSDKAGLETNALGQVVDRAAGWASPEVATNALQAELTALQERLAPVEATPLTAIPARSREFLKAERARLATGQRARAEADAARRAAPQIELTEDGAIARTGPHTVTFAANARTAGGTIHLRLPTGELLRSRVIGLCYFQPDGKSVMLAEVKEKVGELLEPGGLPANRVAYRDAFDAVVADIVYTYTATALEQDIVIRRKLSPPEAFGLDNRVAKLGVITAFEESPEPRQTLTTVDLRPYYADGMARGEELLGDTTVNFGSMRIVAGKAFTLGKTGAYVPVGKAWQLLRGPEGEALQCLVEATPYALIAPQLDALPAAGAPEGARAVRDFKDVLQASRLPVKKAQDKREMAADLPSRPAGQLPGKAIGTADSHPQLRERMTLAQAAVDATPGVVLDYLIVVTPLLNVNFADNSKLGGAAVGQNDSDLWNSYTNVGVNFGALTNLLWSDGSASTVGLTITNAQGAADNPFCLDPMYASYLYPSNSGHILVTITNLPADVYDFYVYATRASSAGAPMIQLKRAGVSLWTKDTTRWGDGWYSTFWDEGAQYVRFRNIAVTSQSIVLDAYPDQAGVASLSGLQIVPAGAIPSETPAITNLLNVDFGGSSGYKVGPAAVGVATNDYWNCYSTSGSAVSVPNLRWANSNQTSIGMVVRNASGLWGVATLFDKLLHSWRYTGGGGSATVVLTNLPAGNCDVYVYTPQYDTNHNSIYEVWSEGVPQGVKATVLCGYPSSLSYWEPGLQYVVFKDVTVSPGEPLIVQSKRANDGYAYFSGLQVAYTSTVVDSDADGLPDSWERKWFGNLNPAANDDPDNDGLTNAREYRAGTDPQRYDSDADGVADGLDAEIAWLEDASPQGAVQYTSGGDAWTWVTSWSDGVGWGGGTIYPNTGAKLRVSANTTNTMHQHYFERATSVIRPGTGDVLYAYVNLDPTKPPTEVMLQFQTLENNGSYGWEHRAYWGANSLSYGTDGTISRTNIGGLPATGQWVRLQVPASKVGLEGKIIEGMAFTLYSGRAAWDRAGVFNPDLDGDGSQDLDGDGLADAWEMTYFGNLNQGTDGDSDGDGITNLWEFRWGLNPTVYDSRNGLSGNAPFLIFTPLK
ncbi:MAG TPA: thrombospondin type 3 repeat-containing protein [Verrucomicrobiae bacterium]